MKDKLKLIDVSMVSTYMGRWLTVFVTVLVIGIAVSALVNRRGGATRNIIDVCVPHGVSSIEALRIYEPFRVLLGHQTRRPVVLSARAQEWPAGCDMYVMPLSEYVRHGDGLGVEAIYEVGSTARYRESAIIVARSSDEDVDFSTLSPAAVAFRDPSSVNGFWVQMSLLVDEGFPAPTDLSMLRFEGVPSGGSRVIFGVLYGAYRFGACTLTELTDLTERGLIRHGELKVVRKAEGLPEVVVAVRAGEADYYKRKLRSIELLLGENVSPVTQDDTVELLKSHGMKRLRPIHADEIDKAVTLYAGLRGLF